MVFDKTDLQAIQSVEAKVPPRNLSALCSYLLFFSDIDEKIPSQNKPSGQSSHTKLKMILTFFDMTGLQARTMLLLPQSTLFYFHEPQSSFY